LPVGVRQRVEIIKTLYRQSDLLVLDEPTAVLTPQEDEELFEIMRSLQASGTSIVFITHKLNEVLAIADRITVLRRGRVVGTTTPAEATRESLASMMVGRSVDLIVDQTPAKPRGPVLEIGASAAAAPSPGERAGRGGPSRSRPPAIRSPARSRSTAPPSALSRATSSRR